LVQDYAQNQNSDGQPKGPWGSLFSVGFQELALELGFDGLRRVRYNAKALFGNQLA
jgi:hypothetical protein